MSASDFVWNPDRFLELVKRSEIKDLWRIRELLGIYRDEFQRCCGRKKGSPSLSSVIRIADFFAVPLDFLIGRCTEKEARNLLENYAKGVKAVRTSFGQAFEEPWPYNLITDLYFEPLQRPITEDQQKGLECALNELSDREKDSILARYRDGESEIYEEIAKRWGVTRERARQIHFRALRKLRAPFRRSMILLGLERSVYEEALDQREQEIVAQWFALEQEQDTIDELCETLGEEKKDLLGRYEERRRHSEVLNRTGISKLNLSVRAHNCLSRAGVKTVGDLLRMSEEDLFQVRNLGRKTVDEIIEKARDFTGIESFPIVPNEE